jgi:alpha-beta hydrolase superfamily lysophospholipase
MYRLAFLLLFLSGCTNLFFFPDNILVHTPDEFGIKFKETEFEHKDGTKIRGWYLLAEGEAQGTILFFHGNAQNISTHIGSVYWLPKAGFNVFLLDYRGYGVSDGSPSVEGAISDIELSIKSFQNEKRPIIVYAQSIGASLSVPTLAKLSKQKDLRVDGIILESPFASYQQIAREKLGSFFLTWPLQYPLSLLISDQYAPDKTISQLPKVPLLMINSKDDTVVLPHHTLDLYSKANEPKELWTYESAPHIGIFQKPETQGRLLEYLKVAVRKFNEF